MGDLRDPLFCDGRSTGRCAFNDLRGVRAVRRLPERNDGAWGATNPEARLRYKGVSLNKTRVRL